MLASSQHCSSVNFVLVPHLYAIDMISVSKSSSFCLLSVLNAKVKFSTMFECDSTGFGCDANVFNLFSFLFNSLVHHIGDFYCHNLLVPFGLIKSANQRLI